MSLLLRLIRQRSRKVQRSLFIVVGLLPFVASCNLLMPLAVLGEHRKKVAPEFDKLANRRVAVLVWTDAAILFDYPHARFELASYVGDKLHTELNQRKMGTSIIDPRDVEDFLQKSPDARIDPQAVGRKFNADYVVYLEVVQFQIRDPDAPQFLQGRINSSVAVHEIGARGDAQRKYELTSVDCLYPDNAPVVLTATNSPLVREGVYRKFAEEVARKFYEYTVEL